MWNKLFGDSTLDMVAELEQAVDEVQQNLTEAREEVSYYQALVENSIHRETALREAVNFVSSIDVDPKADIDLGALVIQTAKAFEEYLKG